MKKTFWDLSDKAEPASADGLFDGIKAERVPKKTVSAIENKVVGGKKSAHKNGVWERRLAASALAVCMFAIVVAAGVVAGRTSVTNGEAQGFSNVDDVKIPFSTFMFDGPAMSEISIAYFTFDYLESGFKNTRVESVNNNVERMIVRARKVKDGSRYEESYTMTDVVIDEVIWCDREELREKKELTVWENYYKKVNETGKVELAAGLTGTTIILGENADYYILYLMRYTDSTNSFPESMGDNWFVYAGFKVDFGTRLGAALGVTRNKSGDLGGNTRLYREVFLKYVDMTDAVVVIAVTAVAAAGAVVSAVWLIIDKKKKRKKE